MCNRTSPKTNEQIGRELAVIRDVEEELAARRKAATLKQNQEGGPATDVEHVPPREEETGKARDIAAAKLGISGKHGDKLLDVLEAVEILKEAAKAEAARYTAHHNTAHH